MVVARQLRLTSYNDCSNSTSGNVPCVMILLRRSTRNVASHQFAAELTEFKETSSVQRQVYWHALCAI